MPNVFCLGEVEVRVLESDLRILCHVLGLKSLKRAIIIEFRASNTLRYPVDWMHVARLGIQNVAHYFNGFSCEIEHHFVVP